MTFMTRIDDIIRKRRSYNETVRAIRSMPADIALDLDIYKGDARAIARQAVYGD